jgi:methylsterol monooxygenase
MLLELGAFIVIFDVLFYYCHRLLHTAWLYRFHKSHHTWRAPIAVATAFGHPVLSLTESTQKLCPARFGITLLNHH